MPTLNKAVADWISQVTQRNPLPETCVALLVGLFQGENTYYMYVSGSDEYDRNDDDWACNQDFTPEPRYLDTGVSLAVPWESVLDSVVISVREVLEGSSNTILHHVPHVSVGFDDGELTYIK